MGAVGVTARAVAEAAPELSLLQWRVLVVLAGSPDGRTVSEVADRIGSRLPATSRLLGRLRRRGLVEAHKDQPDARLTTVTLAADGLALHGRVVQQRREDLGAALDGAGLQTADPAGLERLAAMFETFL